ncbi:MAG TPA: hypothetical protein DIW81_09010 [Planctomycetaceae bacterium]|nr:hypothetical protein [Rubinisphaera sp.]HCS51716.1 hypothetical protein [Planctomycetaceae bacterium]
MRGSIFDGLDKCYRSDVEIRKKRDHDSRKYLYKWAVSDFPVELKGVLDVQSDCHDQIIRLLKGIAVRLH